MGQCLLTGSDIIGRGGMPIWLTSQKWYTDVLSLGNTVLSCIYTLKHFGQCCKPQGMVFKPLNYLVDSCSIHRATHGCHVSLCYLLWPCHLNWCSRQICKTFKGDSDVLSGYICIRHKTWTELCCFMARFCEGLLRRQQWRYTCYNREYVENGSSGILHFAVW